MNFIENKKDSLVYMTAPNIAETHAFTTRFGGVSEGIFSSLNLAENRGDENDRVRKNFETICSELGICVDDLVFSRQVHKADVRHVSAKDRHTLFTPIPYEADGLITTEKDVPLVIFTADCVPILLSDPVRGAIGAVHAGWRGTALDIVGETTRKMITELGCKARNIQAAIGPSISQCCFETGSDVPQALSEVLGMASGAYIAPRSGGKFMVDLKGCNKRLLLLAGLPEENIFVSDECTSCSSDKYWSHRKTNGQRGSQASIIVMKGTQA